MGRTPRSATESQEQLCDQDQDQNGRHRNQDQFFKTKTKNATFDFKSTYTRGGK